MGKGRWQNGGFSRELSGVHKDGEIRGLRDPRRKRWMSC